jgi:hypothetical protein
MVRPIVGPSLSVPSWERGRLTWLKSEMITCVMRLRDQMWINYHPWNGPATLQSQKSEVGKEYKNCFCGNFTIWRILRTKFFIWKKITLTTCHNLSSMPKATQWTSNSRLQTKFKVLANKQIGKHHLQHRKLHLNMQILPKAILSTSFHETQIIRKYIGHSPPQTQYIHINCKYIGPSLWFSVGYYCRLTLNLGSSSRYVLGNFVN